MTKNNKTLSEIANEVRDSYPLSYPKPVDRVIWVDGKVTISPQQFVNDPYIKAHIKYYNSDFFRKKTKSIVNYRKGLELIFDILITKGFDFVPDNIIALLLARLKKEKVGPIKIYLIITSAKSLSLRKVKPNISKLSGSDFRDFNSLEFDQSQRLILSEVFNSSPVVNRPDPKHKLDLVEYFKLDCSGHDLLVSLRTFCVWYLNEWAEIRRLINKECQKELCLLREGFDYKSLEKNFSGEIELSILWDIVKKIKKPIFTELFVSQYLGSIGVTKKNLSDKATSIWNYSEGISTSANYDWYIIIEKFRSTMTGLLLPASNDGTRNEMKRVQKEGKSKNLPLMDSSWTGVVSGSLKFRDIFGHTKMEELVCSWLLASERHQPSGLRLMNTDDIRFINNSVSTITTISSLKGRNGIKTGKTHVEVPEGEKFNKGTSIYKALKSYIDNLKNGYKNSCFPIRNGIIGDALFPLIATDEEHLGRGFIDQKYSILHETKRDNSGLFLISMKGSLSREYFENRSPKECILFSDLLGYSAKLHRIDCERNNKKTAKWRVGHEEINRQVVNNALGKFYSESTIPLSSDNKLKIDDDDSMIKLENTANLHNHSLGVLLGVYGKHLPKNLVSGAHFGARVGEEMLKMVSKISMESFESTQLMTRVELREKLGLSTTMEIEKSQDFQSIIDHAELQDYLLNEMGVLKGPDKSFIILRHPIVIALINAKIKSIDEQIDTLEFSNPKRIREVVSTRIYLSMVLKEKFTPVELLESEDLYGDVDFPMRDILV
jgi:hypothetical protein